MPYISLKTNVMIEPEQEKSLKFGFGEAIELIPGKSESWLMVSVEGSIPLYFKGEDRPAAFVEVKLLGQGNRGAYEKLSAAITGMLTSQLAIPPDRVYIQYEECSLWAWNGGLF